MKHWLLRYSQSRRDGGGGGGGGGFFLVAQSKYSKYYVAQKNISYFLEPTTQRGLPNARVNSEPMVSKRRFTRSQNYLFCSDLVVL